MPIWRLEPCDLDDPNWQASSHRGPVLVRASSEASARETAEKAFSVKTRFVPGKGTQVPPWRRSQLVDAKIVENAVYADEGPEEILEPSFPRDLSHHERRSTRALRMNLNKLKRDK